ncbi:hypothetical protein ACQKLP_12370 [Chitinophaga sp. NPDC101104]|uniref:hypothetical protein n=1 Tax=Chitinophaga sp. NPDC101104 TaxID=3390561 RepID=UPI003D017C5F
MKLYRIIHKSLVHELSMHPGFGATISNDNAFLLAFDSFAMAVLEHPFYSLVLGFPTTFHVVIYGLPDTERKHITESPACLYEEREIGNRKLGSWVDVFLHNNTALCAEYQSRDWPSQSNYVINIRHPLFSEVVIEETFAVK